MHSQRNADHVHDVRHGEDEDGSHGPGVPSPARVVDPRGEGHEFLGKDLTQQSNSRLLRR